MGLSNDGECIQSIFHIGKVDELGRYLDGKPPPFKPLHEDRFHIEDKEVKNVEKVLNWDDEKNSGRRRDEQLDLCKMPGISIVPVGAGVNECSIDDPGKLVQQTFDQGCKTKKVKSGESWHPYLAKVPAFPAGTDIVLTLDRQGSTTIKGKGVQWADIFGSSDWPRI